MDIFSARGWGTACDDGLDCLTGNIEHRYFLQSTGILGLSPGVVSTIRLSLYRFSEFDE